MIPKVIPKPIYINTAACGLVPENIAASGIDFYKSLQQGSASAEYWRTHLSESIRKNIAHFLKAQEQNIAMIPCFSYGMNAIVQSLKGTEKILLYEFDYPSLCNPFKVNNYDIHYFQSENDFYINPQTIEEKIKSEAIDILAISHTQWLSGALVDLKSIINICHKNNAIIIVDGTQSLGAMPIYIDDLKPDVFIASNYKWMNAGFGTGILYASNQFLDKYPPVFGGVNSYVWEKEQEVRKSSIFDYEPGHLNMAGFSILEAAILNKQKQGLENIRNHNYKLTELFINACATLPVSLIGASNMKNRSSIVVLKDENGLGEWLQKHNFILTLRNNTIRLSFHDYNTEQEVYQLLDVIASKHKG